MASSRQREAVLAAERLSESRGAPAPRLAVRRRMRSGGCTDASNHLEPATVLRGRGRRAGRSRRASAHAPAAWPLPAPPCRPTESSWGRPARAPAAAVLRRQQRRGRGRGKRRKRTGVGR
eukprot:352861-Chlamydomonas_euryale.AAC.11